MAIPTITLNEVLNEEFFDSHYSIDEINTITAGVLKYYDDKMVYKVHLYLTHDGYDCDGPKSNLYNLYIWTKEWGGDDRNDVEHCVDVWRYEDWYDRHRNDMCFWFNQQILITENSWNNSYNDQFVNNQEPDIPFDPDTDYVRSALNDWC